MGLTAEQKTEFKKKGEEYRNLKYEIDEEIIKHHIKIGNLEKEIMDSMPKTPDGRLFCKSCYVRSMAYIGRTPKGSLSGGGEIYRYRCEICGHEEVGDTFF